MKFILAKKIEMTQRFSAAGEVVPVTAVTAGPCVVTQVKDVATDGYGAVQVGFGQQKRPTKARAGHVKGLPVSRHLAEFRFDGAESFKRGATITAAVFQPGDTVHIIGVSKGKGFQGVVRRHHFRGGPASHGHKDNLRMPGSIGSTAPQRVFKGMRMAGHMGDRQITVQNLEVVEVDAERNIIFLKGAVPGARNGLLMISGEGEMNLPEPAVVAVQPPAAAPAEQKPDSKEKV